MINHTNKKHGDSAVSMGFSTMTDILGYKSITGAFISLLYTTSFLWRFLKTNLWILEDELYEGSCPFLHRTSVFFKHFDLYNDCKAWGWVFFFSTWCTKDVFSITLCHQKECTVRLLLLLLQTLLFCSRGCTVYLCRVIWGYWLHHRQYLNSVLLCLWVLKLFLRSPGRYSWWELGKTSKYKPVNTETFLKVNYLQFSDE